MQWFRNMKIKSKLFLAFGILVSLMLISTILGIWLFVSTDYQYSNLITGTIQRHFYLSRAMENMTAIRLGILSRMYSAADGAQAETIAGFYENFDELNQAFQENIDNYYNNIRLDPDITEQERQGRLVELHQVSDQFYTYLTQNEVAARIAAENNDTEGLNAVLLDSVLITNTIAARLENLYRNAFVIVEAKNKDVMADSISVTILIFAISGFFFLFAILVSIYMTKAIRTPISKMQTAMAEISQGNLAFPIRSGNKDELGKLSNVIGDMVDQISEMNKTVTVMDFLDSMIHIVSLNFNIIYINEKMAEASGVDKLKSVGQKCYKVLHGLDRPCPYCLWPRTLSTKEQNKVFVRDRYWDEKLGKWLGGKAAIIRWIDGSPVQFYYLVDETMHHNYEAKLEEAAEEARAASHSKTAFLANMSHEIRTPMNAILGITEIQMENESLPKDTKEALGKIYSSGDLLLGIINDILDMSKIEAGKLELLPSKYEVASLINDTVHLNMMRFESKPIELKLQVDADTPATLIGDELRIKQILNNLLSNAAKYTPEGEVVFYVSAELGEEDAVTLILKVQDTGQGMTPDQVSKLFDAYSRFNLEVNRTIEGTGLGMSITSKLLQMMNGEINVESEAGKGSVFTVRIPQTRVGSTPLGRELADQLQQFRVNFTTQTKNQVLREPMPYGSVLVVDDMEANLYVAKGLLKPYELKIDTAESGFEAIDKIIAGNSYDIVFMDHMMPKMDGIEAVKIIREMGYTRSIVALTANAVAGQADVFLSNGFDDFISKPIDTRQLNDALNKLIRDKQAPEVVAAVREQLKANQKEVDDTIAELSDFSGDPLLEELSRIEDLNVRAGLGFIGYDKENYLNVLRFFTEKCDSYLEELDKTFKSVTWGDYAVKVHALKGVLANIGAERLSKWAAKLEKASKQGADFSPDTCREETQPFIADLAEFRDKLRSTSLIESPSAEEEAEKPKGETVFLKEQMALLKDACIKYSFKEIKAIIAGLQEYGWDGDTQKELEDIRQFTVSLDYDKALEGINRLL